MDFGRASGNRDGIVLSFDACTVAHGFQDFTFIGGAGYSAAGQVRAFVSSGNTFVSANTDANTGTTEWSVMLSGVHTLTVFDFVL